VEYRPDNLFENRKFVIGGIAIAVVLLYIIQLFRLQILSPEYRAFADSNAFFRKTLYPARGSIYDRNGKLIVFNEPTYDIMMNVREMTASNFDTLDFCRALDIDKMKFEQLLSDMKDRRKNPGYSSYTPQLFMSQLDVREFGLLQEKLYKFPGVYIQNRTRRQYKYPNMGLILGYVAEVDKNKLDSDPYYVRGDYAGKSGIERFYEEDLRGVKGVEILLRDSKGRIQGKYKNGAEDKAPQSGRDLTLGIDIDLQAYGEYLMQNKIGAIVMIEPRTGEILCMIASPSYDPSLLTGKDFGKNYLELERNPYKPLINRAISGMYPPGSTFKPSQGAIFLQENIINTQTQFSCNHGYPPLGGRPACHSHPSPLSIVPALATSCNSFFCYGFNAMLSNREHYSSQSQAFDIWGNYLSNMGYGHKLGIDLPSEKTGFIPNNKFYNKLWKDNWNAHRVISIAIGQGEILATPLQIANFAAIVANRGYYYAPHVVRQRKGIALNSLYSRRHESGIDKSVFDIIADGMANAVTSGTCRAANLGTDIQVCGKTGTAENPHGEDHSLFMAFAPKNDPKVAIAVVVENGGFGARNAVPIGRLMLQKYFRDSIPESDKWIEEQIASREILPFVYQKNAIIKAQSANVNQ